MKPEYPRSTLLASKGGDLDVKTPDVHLAGTTSQRSGALFRFLVGAFGFVDGYRWSFVTNGGAR